MQRLLWARGPGYASGADLLAAALDLKDRGTTTSGVAEHLGVPLGVIRGWLRDDR